MNPWLLAGGGAALLALLAASSSSTASTDSMVFKDYTWVTSLPAVATTEARPPNPLAAQLPAPPGVTTPGKWVQYPAGKLLLKRGGGVDPLLGGASNGGITLGIWPGVPANVDVYAWAPLLNNTPHALQRGQWTMTQINGFYVSSAPFHVEALGGGHFHWDSQLGYPPPPPGQSHQSGHWKMVHPSYLVWLTPATSNQAASDTGQYGSAYGFNLGALPTTAAAPSSSIFSGL
jgi:hypothetical protein